MPYEIRRYSPYGNFAEGDYVTRFGDDVHLVRDMDDDLGFAEFVCVVAPTAGWCAVGDVDRGMCSRYERCERPDMPARAD